MLCLPALLLSAQPSSSLFRERLADLAISHTWVREIAPNRSREIDKFNLDAGVQKGSNWCLSFIYSMAKRVSNTLKIRNPLPRTGACWKMLREAKRYGNDLRIVRTRNAGDLQKGDIGIIRKGGGSEREIGKQWEGHAYLVAIPTAGRIAKTVEGNTNTDGSRNGNRVAKRTRDIAKTLAFIRVE